MIYQHRFIRASSWILILVFNGLFFLSLGPAEASESTGLAPIETYSAEEKSHWAYRPITRPDPPEVQGSGWVQNPIDRFILSELESFDFRPMPPVDRVSLIRRATMAITGLPPTPVEVERFRADERPDAFGQLIDRLLMSPRFGERWAQHWLDLAHYADTNGFELDADRPHAWRYRDWVVKAFNDDLPFDEFVTLQIAGDEVRPDSAIGLIATGFGRCGPREVVSGNIDPKVRRQSELTEVTTTVGSVFLGLTIGCARCHDHKFDAIPTTDYYRLQSYFAGAAMVDTPISTDEERARFKASKKVIDEQIEPFREALARLEAPYRKQIRGRKESELTKSERAVLAIPEGDRTPLQDKMAAGAKKALSISWEEVAEAVANDFQDHQKREQLKRQIFELEQQLPEPPPSVMALIETDEPAEIPETYVYRRGDPHNVGPHVEPRPPGVILASMGISRDFNQDAALQGVENKSGRRTRLAGWLTDPQNPLTARVIVNRIWRHYFGRGIVETPGDFGVRGELPSHPELLDWLASELIDSGWSLKRIHRLILSSSTYQQSGRVDRTAIALEPPSLDRFQNQREDDPENLLFGRMPTRRLDAEAIRDSMLAVSGLLSDKQEGPGVRVAIPESVEELIFTEAEVVDLWPEDPDPREHYRRSLYLYRKRNVRYPLFDAFDAPDTQTICSARDETTHSLQSLVLLNSDFSRDCAEALAFRMIEAAPKDPGAQVEHLYELVLGRSPSDAEREQALVFLNQQTAFLRNLDRDDSTWAGRPIPEGLRVPEIAARIDLGLAMLNRNDFLFIP